MPPEVIFPARGDQHEIILTGTIPKDDNINANTNCPPISFGNISANTAPAGKLHRVKHRCAAD